MNIISDASNYEKFPEIFGKPTEIMKHGRKKTKFVGGTRFQGAVVYCNPEHQGKVVNDITNVDFASLYPSIIMYFNLSPETVSFVRYEDYVKDFFDIIDYDDCKHIIFADDRLNKNVIVKVLKKEGFATKEMRRFYDARMKIKDKIAKKEGNILHLKSMSVVYKVLLNSYFGVTGSGFQRYANVYQAMTVTAIGRFLIRKVMEKYGHDLLLTDTDGCYGMREIDAVGLANDINHMLKERFNVDASFVLDSERYDAGFALKMKNYILMKKDKPIIKHGVSFKASSKNLIFKNALDNIATTLLTGGDVLKVAKEAYDVDKCDFSEFIMRTNINRAVSEYANQPGLGRKGCLQVQVAKQASKFHDMGIRIGDQIAYVKTPHGYEIKETAEVKDNIIDKNYYKKQVLSVLERFKLPHVIWKLKNPGQEVLTAY
jgi:DNA polymerase I